MIKALMTVSLSVFLLVAPLTFGIPVNEKNQPEDVIGDIMAGETFCLDDGESAVTALPGDDVSTDGVIRMLGVRNDTASMSRVEVEPGDLDPQGVIRMLGVRNETTTSDTE